MAGIPKHVAIVMDGNGRWAKNRGLPRVMGHRAGVEAVQKAVQFCVDQAEISVLTLFALSVENFKCRPQTEVKLLLRLFLESLQRNLQALHDKNISIKIIGDRSIFNDRLLAVVDEAETLTANNQGLTLAVAINYSGRWDIVQASKRLARLVALKQLDVDAIDDEIFARHLSLQDFTEPDLLIRTSGEQRISNFMLWQFAYTELYFPDCYWPDFDENIFKQALTFYASRQRRYGRTGEQVKQEAEV